MVAGGVGVGGAAEGGDDLLDLLFAAVRGGAAGNDVLQDVAQSRAQVAALVRTAGILHVAADGGHRRGVVFLDDDRQAVIELGQRDVFRQPLLAGILRNGRLRIGREEDRGRNDERKKRTYVFVHESHLLFLARGSVGFR